MKKQNDSRFGAPVYRAAFCGARSKIGLRVVSGTDADSIAADVFAMSLRLQEKAGQQETRQSDELPFYESGIWAYRAGQWRAGDALRKEQVFQGHTPFLSKNIEDSKNRPEGFATMTEEQRMVQQGLLSLRFQDAVYLFCRYWMDLSNKGVAEFWAELTGEHLSERTHVMRFKNANDRLRRKLEPSVL